MNRFLIALLFCHSFIYAQVNEKFDDGECTTNPVWEGNASAWTVVNGQLRSNSSTASSTFQLSTPSAIATNAEWEFYVNLKFQTSSSNYTDIFLISDSANLISTTSSGYFVRIGNTADEISLYKRIRGKNTKIIDGADAKTNSSNNTLKVLVRHDTANLWTLQSDITGTGKNYVQEGATVDASLQTSTYFGIVIKQSTASFHLKHFYDDISVRKIVSDTTKPVILTITLPWIKQIDLKFNEDIDTATAQNVNNYTVNNGIGNPLSAQRDSLDFTLVHLIFANSFVDGLQNTLHVSRVADMHRNTLDTLIQFSLIIPDTAIFKDVLLNELFANPTSSVGLPEIEFVELYNRSSKTLALKGWQIADASGSSTAILGTYEMLPHTYLIVCKNTDTALLKPYGNVLGSSNFPTLNNSGDAIYLSNNLRETIDSVNYTTAWYHDVTKQNGGYTLELINPEYRSTCPPSENWKAAENAEGGTPGGVNSVHANDNKAPSLVRCKAVSATSLLLIFNEVLDSISLLNTAIYTVNNGVGNPQNVSCQSDFRSILLTFLVPFEAGTEYVISLSTSITDCANNTLNTLNTATFFVPEKALTTDIVINEILFNPKGDGVDFVELYNRSTKTIDLQSLSLANYDTMSTAAINAVPLSDSALLMRPQTYLIMSSNGARVRSQYHTSNPNGFLDIKVLPKMNNDAGTICLVSADGVMIDLFIYNENMHYALLTDREGVSLERIDFDRPSSDKSNWHSAATTVGYASPAYENSQYAETNSTTESIAISPEIFSPDEDGMNDIVTIHYQFETGGYTGSITIYDSNGRLVKRLINNQLLGTNGIISWDGINEHNEKGRIGIYLVHIEVYDLKGTVKHFKKPVVLAGKLN
jgi:Lamin Tail Domain/CHU_C Type IX secretion signal domain